MFSLTQRYRDKHSSHRTFHLEHYWYAGRLLNCMLNSNRAKLVIKYENRYYKFINVLPKKKRNFKCRFI